MEAMFLSNIIVLVLLVQPALADLTEQFKDAKVDPCCEHVRVHYQQHIVYQILNIHHEDLKTGINCFQRVCPSQFPAFYRIMYAGGLPGTSVSFAVCSNDDPWEGSDHAPVKPSLREIYVPRQRGSRKAKRYAYFYGRVHQKMMRTKRDGAAGRTIFEIPEPRPSVVYTLTGVCFCLRVTSKPIGNNPVPANKETSSTRRMQRQHLKFQHVNQRASERTFEQGRDAYHVISKKNATNSSVTSTVHKQTFSPKGTMADVSSSVHQTGQGRQLPILPERRNRNSFLDSFVNLVFSRQQKTHVLTTPMYFEQTNMKVTRTTKLTQSERKTMPKITPPSRGLDSLTSYSADVRQENPSDVIEGDSTPVGERMTTRDTSNVHGKGVDDDVKAGDNDSNQGDNDDANRLIVFASFSHDVHFIGTISMRVSVASSCSLSFVLSLPRVSITLSKFKVIHTFDVGSQELDKQPIWQQGTGSQLCHQTDTAHSRTQTALSSNSPALNATEAVVAAVQSAGETSDDVLLVWQIASGAVLSVFFVVSVVLCLALVRRRKRNRKRYLSPRQEERPQNFRGTTNASNSPTDVSAPPAPPARSTSAVFSSVGGSAPSTAAIGILRGGQPGAWAGDHRDRPMSAVRVNAVYPMHIRLRSLSAAKEAARLRGQAALRMLNNESSASDETSNDDHVTMDREGAPHRKRQISANELEIPGQAHGSNERDNGRQRKRSLNPKIIVSNGSTKREFDLGKFAVYRNDIILKLRSVSLRPGRKKDKQQAGDTDYQYDNMELGQDESVYACYAGGETDI